MFIEHITIWKCDKCPRKCVLKTKDRACPAICLYTTTRKIEWEMHEPENKGT